MCVGAGGGRWERNEERRTWQRVGKLRLGVELQGEGTSWESGHLDFAGRFITK